MNQELRVELLAMAERDQRVRSELATDGSLYRGRYHPRMERVQRENAVRLKQILDRHGWPGRSLVGRDGAEAAWLILQHAIGSPVLQRAALLLLRQAVAAGEAESRHAAYLEDRVAFFEGRPQRYGTHFDWDASGELSPHPIEEPESVDARRAEVGLPPLDEQVRRMREEPRAAGERPPDDLEGYRARQHDWAVAVRWRRPAGVRSAGSEEEA